MKRALSTITDPDFLRQEALAREIHVLLQMAGIARSVENLDRLYRPRYWTDAPVGFPAPDGRVRSPKRPTASQRDGYQHDLRHYYFSVADPLLRRRLIAKEREFHQLTLSCTMADLTRARADLTHVEAWAYSEFPAAAIGAIILVVGTAIVDLAGGMVTAGLAVVGWLYSFRAHRRRALREIATARANVEMWDGVLRVEQEQPEVFSEAEQLSGVPDTLERDDAASAHRA